MAPANIIRFSARRGGRAAGKVGEVPELSVGRRYFGVGPDYTSAPIATVEATCRSRGGKTAAARRQIRSAETRLDSLFPKDMLVSER